MGWPATTAEDIKDIVRQSCGTFGPRFLAQTPPERPWVFQERGTSPVRGRGTTDADFDAAAPGADDEALGVGHVGWDELPYGQPLVHRPPLHTHGRVSVRSLWHSSAVGAPAHHLVLALARAHSLREPEQHVVPALPAVSCSLVAPTTASASWRPSFKVHNVTNRINRLLNIPYNNGEDLQIGIHARLKP